MIGAAWLPDHRTLALIDNTDSRVLLVDSRHPNPARSRATALAGDSHHAMMSIAVSPDGHWMAAEGW